MTPGTPFLFHPEENPATTIKAEVIKTLPHNRLYAEVQNETHPVTGKRLNFHATDLCGCKTVVHQNQIVEA